jgi:hypothetical protein
VNASPGKRRAPAKSVIGKSGNRLSDKIMPH